MLNCVEAMLIPTYLPTYRINKKTNSILLSAVVELDP